MAEPEAAPDIQLLRPKQTFKIQPNLQNRVEETEKLILTNEIYDQATIRGSASWMMKEGFSVGR